MDFDFKLVADVIKCEEVEAESNGFNNQKVDQKFGIHFELAVCLEFSLCYTEKNDEFM